MAPPDRREVFVTGIGRISYCKRCAQPITRCRCKEDQIEAGARPGLPRDGWVRLARETKGRGGKVVTLIAGLPADNTLLSELTQTLKKFCGAGGSVEDGVIVIQGDHRDRLVPKLQALGYQVKRVGG